MYEEGSLFRAALVRDYVCAQCEAGLVEVCNGRWKVVCSADHSHRGRIRKSTVEMRRQREVLEGIEVAMAYYQFAPKSPESVARDWADLFGQERRTTCPSRA